MNFNYLTQTLSTLYTLSRTSARRKPEYRKVGKTELIMEIYLELKLLEFSGESYWNHTKILDGLYRRRGFPCRGDKQANALFDQALKYVQSKFVPMPGRRRNYSFNLVEDQTGITAKFLNH